MLEHRSRAGAVARALLGSKSQSPSALRPCLAAAVALVAVGCELTEVEVAPGTRTLVVQSVINRAQRDQFVIVEYSLSGETPGTTSGNPVPPGAPRLPISGARVTVEQLGGSSCPGRIDTLSEFSSGIYRGTLCGTDPGAALRLRVLTPQGEEVIGTARIPDVVSREVRVGSNLATSSRDTVVLNRDRDTIFISVASLSGRVLQVEARQSEGEQIHPHPDLFLFADTMRLRILGKLVNPFHEQEVFLAGRYYRFTVAVGDTNYYDYLRSRSDPFTARGYINRLHGGIGVFGAVDAATYVVRVVGDWRDAREGLYRATGAAAGAQVDLMIELYLNDRESGTVSAFVQGEGIEGALSASARGSFGPPPQNNPDQFTLAWELSGGRRFELQGVRRRNGSPFPVSLRVSTGRAEYTAGLTMVQLKAPVGGATP